VTRRKQRDNTRQWRVVDLHLHSPASSDFQEMGTSFLDILKRCEARNLDIVSITDHNTVAGYRNIREEIHQLELLENLGRINDEERRRLVEYRRLLARVLVLPGFEFTATFGFHVLAIFPPEKSVREIEHLLLSLNIPPDLVDAGSSTVGATTDVLTAYQAIDDAGGLVIAAHANSTNGVAMRGFGFGGQTKIAYTQDPHLHALEVTDLDQRGRRATADFFSGTKPEYPRRMHCIQGSDSHRLRTDPSNRKNLGIGDRATELLLPEVSFQAVKELFLSHDFARTRPHRPSAEAAYDFMHQAIEQGPSIIQDFHEGMTQRGGRLYAIIADVCAFANTNGGTLYVGVSAEAGKAPPGIPNPTAAVRQLEQEISKKITPALACQVDVQETGGKKILRVLVPRGDDPPYAVDENKIYLRAEAETGLAVRDEIVQLVRRDTPAALEPSDEAEAPVEVEPVGIEAPRTGVEVVAMEERDGVKYYTMRDLRNGNVVKNVTVASARRLWHYALTQYAKLPTNLSKASVAWQGDIGVLGKRNLGKRERFDLAQKAAEGIRVYYGVTEDGIHGEWKRLLGTEAD
jgi:hypothetical protein